MLRITRVRIGLAAAGLLAVAGLAGYFMIFHRAKTKVCFKEVCFEAEIAKTGIAQAKGLMFRKSLGEREGMLFVFKNEGFHSFWMKNTLIPLDIIFLDKNKKVVQIIKAAQPCQSEKCPSYRNQQPSQYVLEINAGTADKIGLAIGSEISFLDN
ncbi:MAG: DUF192 domain-containing protein [Candidatus Pacebacteria bacterium]|nr:DUF192 domain-containing protein [Candidatus Paceibacterota bacterium]